MQSADYRKFGSFARKRTARRLVRAEVLGWQSGTIATDRNISYFLGGLLRIRSIL